MLFQFSICVSHTAELTLKLSRTLNEAELMQKYEIITCHWLQREDDV